MTTATSAEAVISAERHRVYAAFLRVEDYPHFLAEVAAVEQVAPERTRWVIDLGGVRREFETTLTGRTEDDRVAWVVADHRGHRGLAQFEEYTDGRTHLTVATSWEPEGLVERAGAALGLQTRTLQGALERFAEYVEQQERSRRAEGASEPSFVENGDDDARAQGLDARASTPIDQPAPIGSSEQLAPSDD